MKHFEFKITALLLLGLAGSSTSIAQNRTPLEIYSAIQVEDLHLLMEAANRCREIFSSRLARAKEEALRSLEMQYPTWPRNAAGQLEEVSNIPKPRNRLMPWRDPGFRTLTDEFAPHIEAMRAELKNAMLEESYSDDESQNTQRLYIEALYSAEPNNRRQDRVRCFVHDRKTDIAYYFVPKSELPQEVLDQKARASGQATPLQSQATFSQLQAYARTRAGFGTYNAKGRDVVFIEVPELSEEQNNLLRDSHPRSAEFLDASFTGVPQEWTTGWLDYWREQFESGSHAVARPRTFSPEWFKVWKNRFLKIDRGQWLLSGGCAVVACAVTGVVTHVVSQKAGLSPETTEFLTRTESAKALGMGFLINLWQPYMREVYKTGGEIKQYALRLTRTIGVMGISRAILPQAHTELILGAFAADIALTGVSAQYFTDAVRDYMRLRRDMGHLIDYKPVTPNDHPDHPHYAEIRRDLFWRTLVIYPSKKMVINALDRVAAQANDSNKGVHVPWGSAGSIGVALFFKAMTYHLAKLENDRLIGVREAKRAAGLPLTAEERSTDLLFGPYAKGVTFIGRYLDRRNHSDCMSFLERPSRPRDEVGE